MKYTWKQLEEIADNLCSIRDNNISEIPVHIIVVLTRNLKVVEQEIRILSETRNIIKNHCDTSDEYERKLYELRNTPVEVSLRTVSIKDFDGCFISQFLIEKLGCLLEDST